MPFPTFADESFADVYSHPLNSWPNITDKTSGFKPRPNESNISTQHIPTLLAQHLEAPAKRSQHLNATDPNIVGRNLLQAFGHPVATCCDMLRVENRTRAHAQAQHCYTNLAKRLQHHAAATNVAWKIGPFSNVSQQHPTCRNRVAKRTHHVASDNVAICCVQMLRSFGRSLQMLGQQW